MIANTPDSLFKNALSTHAWQRARSLVRVGLDYNGLTEIAMEYGQWDLVEQMIRHGASPRIYHNHISPLHYFCKIKNIDAIKYVLAHGVGDIVDYPPHHSPLKAAAIAGHLEVVKILVEKKASLSSKESLNGAGSSAQNLFTPIQYAAMFGHREIVLYLMNLPDHAPAYADDNMGFSLDFFGHRQDYSAFINMEEVVDSMLQRPRPTDHEVDMQEQRNLRTDILLLQAGAKHYTLQRAVLRLSRENLIQRCDQYLTLSRLSLNILKRSLITTPPVVAASKRPGINRVIVLQKMSFMWFCWSIAIYVRNHPRFKRKRTDFVKMVEYLGAIVDNAADRGYFHGFQLIGLDRGTLFDACFQNVLENLPLLEQFLGDLGNTEILGEFKKTRLYQVVAYLHDREQLSKLQKNYLGLDYVNLLQSSNSNDVEASLNGISSTLEIVTMHLSEFSRPYFQDINFNALSQIRNHLRHVNGDDDNHNAFDDKSRVKRFNGLVSTINSDLKKKLIRFVQCGFQEVRIRIDAYRLLLNSIDTIEKLYLFLCDDTIINHLRIPQWSYNLFRFDGDSSQCLSRELEKPDNTDHSLEIESEIQKHIRINLLTGGLSGDIANAIKAWNRRVRDKLGLNKEYFKRCAPEIKDMVQRILPVGVGTSSVADLSYQNIYLYIKFSANLYYAIASLKKIVNVTKQMPRNVISFNVIEWHAVHFYEHWIEFGKDGSFISRYVELNGYAPERLLFNIQEIRDYIAHVANPEFVDCGGQTAGSERLSALGQTAENILQGLHCIYADWQKLWKEVESGVSDEVALKIASQSQKALTSHVP